MANSIANERRLRPVWKGLVNSRFRLIVRR